MSQFNPHHTLVLKAYFNIVLQCVIKTLKSFPPLRISVRLYMHFKIVIAYTSMSLEYEYRNDRRL